MYKLLKFFLSLFLAVLVFNKGATTARAQMSASDIMGQYLDDNATLTYDLSRENNRPRANPFGFNEHTYVAIDSVRHRLYISDTENERILVWQLDSSDTINYDEPADYVIGQTDFYLYSNGRTQSTLDDPEFLEIDETNGRLFVTDEANGRVLVFDVSGTISNGMNASYVLGQANFTTKVLNTSQNTIRTPSGLAYDSTTDYLYVVDEGSQRVLVYDVTTITNGENAIYVLGQEDFVNYTPAIGIDKLAVPKDVEIDETNHRLFVSDNVNDRIMIFNVNSITNGEDAVNVLGQADFVTSSSSVAQNTVANVSGLEYDPINNLLYATQPLDKRISVFDVTSISNNENAINVLGFDNFFTPSTPTTIGNCGFENDGNLSLPNEVALVGNNLLAVGDCRRAAFFNVATITNGENPVNIIGQTDSEGNTHTDKVISDSAIPSKTSLYLPAGILLDNVNNRLFVADQGNFRILVFNIESDTGGGYFGDNFDKKADYVLGQTDFYTADEALLNQKQLAPLDLAYDSENQYLFATDIYYNRILVFDVSEIENNEDAVYVIGQPDFSTDDYDTTDSTMIQANMIDYDQDDKWLFVGDAYNSRVLIFDLSEGITNGMAASKVLGQDDFVTGSDTSPTQSRISFAEGDITYEADYRRLFVSDPNNSRVLVYSIPATLDEITNGMDADYVIGQSDFTSNASAFTQAGLNFPLGMSMGNDRDLYIFDCYSRILVYNTTSLNNGPNAVGVIGQSNFTTGGNGTSQTSLACNYYSSVEIDNDRKKLFVSDDNNHRILIFDLPKIDYSNTYLPDGNYNQSYSYTIPTTQTNGTISFEIVSGSMPNGLTLDTLTGLIYGTPTDSSSTNYSLIIKLVDDQGNIGQFYDKYVFGFRIIGQTSSSDSSSSSSSSNSSSSNSTQSSSTSTSNILYDNLTSGNFLKKSSKLLDDQLVQDILDKVSDASLVDRINDVFQTEKENIRNILDMSGISKVLGAISLQNINNFIQQTSAALVTITLPTVTIMALTSRLSQLVGKSTILVSRTKRGISSDLFTKILRAIGLIKTDNPLGLVYDSQTKKPIPFALLTFRGKSNQGSSIIETIVTDTKGVFQGISLPAGDYDIEVAKEGYNFPTALLRPKYLRIKEFYKSEKININSKENQILLVPIDKVEKDPEEKKHLSDVIKLHLSRLVNKNLVIPMFSFSAICTLISPSVINILVTGTYVGYFFINKIKYLRHTKLSGYILDENGKPISNAIVRLARQSGQAVSINITNKKGKFVVLAKPEKYQIQIFKLGYINPNSGISQQEVNLENGSLKENYPLKKASPMDTSSSLHQL